jgi:hypothetical protein
MTIIASLSLNLTLYHELGGNAVDFLGDKVSALGKGLLLSILLLSSTSFPATASPSHAKRHFIFGLLVYQQSTQETQDIKYCRLRSDLPVSSRLFTSLSIKATREVVGLYEPEPQQSQREGRRKQQRRKHQGGDDHSQFQLENEHVKKKDSTQLSVTS